MSKQTKTLLGISIVIALAVVFFIAYSNISQDDSTDSNTAQNDTSVVTNTSDSSPVRAQTSGENPDPASDNVFRSKSQYTVPGGDVEPITITVTIEDQVIQDIEVELEATNPTSTFHQGLFSTAFDKNDFIGSPIDSAELDNVAGASLTSNAFNLGLVNIQNQL